MQVQHWTRVVSIAALALLISGGCSVIHDAEEAVADAEQGSAETQLYPIDAGTADALLSNAFAEGWPDKSLVALGEGRIGYTIKLWFGIDREHIIGEALAADGGFRFRVINRGTAPVVGVPARKKLIALLETKAMEANGLVAPD